MRQSKRQWERTRQRIFARDNWTCQICGVILTTGRSAPNAAECGHIIAIINGGTDEDENLEAECKQCNGGKKQGDDRRGYSVAVGPDGWPVDANHPVNSSKRQRKWGYSIPRGVQKSGIPVVLVCGAPGSGKTTYVKHNASASDVVIDLDDIRVSLGGKPWDQSVDRKAFARRDQVIHSLASKTAGRAWLIVTAPTQNERDEWVDALGNVRVHVMDTSEETCLRRIAENPERPQAEHRQAVRKWFEQSP